MTQQTASDLQRLLAEEPFVRSLARNLVADPDDVVQQTWLQALQQGGRRIEQPRSWLRRIVYNVAANLRRGDLRRAARERVVAVHDLVPSSLELMEREERRRSLVAAVDELPSSLRTVLLLRYFEGLPPRRIAADLGLPVTTVWTQLSRGLELLRQRLDSEHGGDRRAWLAPLLSFGVPPTAVPAPVGAPAPAARPTPLAPVLWTGVIAMTTKTKIVAAAAVLLALAGAFVVWPDGAVSGALSPAEPGPGPTMTGRAAVSHEEQPNTAAADPSRREPITAPVTAIAKTGELVVRVRYGDDQQPAPGILMIVRHPGGDFRVDTWRARTGDTGEASFAALPPGRLYVVSDRGTVGKLIQIQAGKSTELDFEMKVGLTITGVVVDASGTPLGGALVEVAPLARADFDVQVLVTTGADGRFAVRCATTHCLVGARAAGHAASGLQFLFGKPGNTADVRIELGRDGGVVDGIVVRSDGTPVPHAVVVVGSGKTVGIIAGANGAPPVPALVRSDELGRFRAVGIPPGEQPVVARATGFGPWQGKCHVVAHATAPLRITLIDGANLNGVVRDDTGSVVRGAEVRIGNWGDFTHYRTRTAADGTFAFTGLPPGGVEVVAKHDELGHKTARVHTTAGTTTDCEIKLARGVELIGRVLDQAGSPVERVSLEVSGVRPGGGFWGSHARTDAEGRFAVTNCPDGATLTVRARGLGIRNLQRTDVDPKAGTLELRVQRTLPPSARIIGHVVGPDGKPVPNARVSVSSEERFQTTGIHPTGEDGEFEFGPLVPGSWRVHVRGTAYPDFVTEPYRLDAEVTWKVGAIQLIHGGTAVVKIDGEDAAKVMLRVVDVGETLSLYVEKENGSGPRRTNPLPPGDYRLLVTGKGIAAQAVPFSIRAGAETKLEVRLQTGTSQRVEFVVPRGVTLKKPIRLRVLQGGEFVQRAWAFVRKKAPVATVWLAPGKYRVTATAGDLRGSVTFNVGPDPAPPVRIELR